MAVTEETRQSWMSRLGDSFKSVVTGLVLFIGSFLLLFWNEGRAVKTAKALEQGEASVVTIDASKVSALDEGRLVHLTGKAETAAVLFDSDFGVSVNAIRLERKVEMFQWLENKETTTVKNLGGSETKKTTYTYSKGWSASAIDSSAFKEAGHTNPGALPYPAQTSYAKDVSVGAFRLTEGQIHSMGQAEELMLTGAVAVPSIAGKMVVKTDRGYYLTAVKPAVPLAASVVAPTNVVAAPVATNAVAVAAPAPAPAIPAQPEIGDVRISYRVVLPHEISLVAVQKGNTFAPFTASNGKTIQLLTDGVHTAQEMFAQAKQGNTMLTWVMRLVGFFLMYVGLGMIFGPLSVLGDVVPFIGSLLGGATKFAAFLISLPCTLVTIAIAWFAYRPVYGIGLLVVAGALLVFLFSRKKDKGQNVPQQQGDQK